MPNVAGSSAEFAAEQCRDSTAHAWSMLQLQDETQLKICQLVLRLSWVVRGGYALLGRTIMQGCSLLIQLSLARQNLQVQHLQNVISPAAVAQRSLGVTMPR